MLRQDCGNDTISIGKSLSDYQGALTDIREDKSQLAYDTKQLGVVKANADRNFGDPLSSTDIEALELELGLIAAGVIMYALDQDA